LPYYIQNIDALIFEPTPTKSKSLSPISSLAQSKPTPPKSGKSNLFVQQNTKPPRRKNALMK
jgi:hypothetical protein